MTLNKFKKYFTLPIIITTLVLLCGIVAVIAFFYEPPAPQEPFDPKLNTQILDESLELGKNFILNNQKPEGNFNYEYNFITGEFTDDDNQVRQAGALWGVALINRYSPSDETLASLLKGLKFFDSISQENEYGKYVVYPNEDKGRSGTIALITLSLLELLQTDQQLDNREFYETELDKYLNFLISLRRDDGLFYGAFDFETGEGTGSPSSYFDGEGLLALAKATKYLERKDLEKLTLDSADAMYEENVTKALEKDPDSAITKGFYQWSSMSFYEIYTSDFGKKKYATYAIDLAYWMIDIHNTLGRTRNTAYAYEGLVSAYELARLTKNKEAMNKILRVIDEGLYKLTSWQVGVSIQNKFLSDNPTTNPLGIGGIMNARDEAPLRIDVTQHQMHAVTLAREFIYQ